MKAAQKWRTAARCTAARWTTMAAALSLAAVLASGCVGERAFFIGANNSTCITTAADSAAVGLSAGVLDLDGLQAYVFSPELHNDMLASVSRDGEPERNRLLLRRFEVDLNLGALGQGVPAELTSFAVPATGLIEPGGLLLVTNVPLVPAALVTILNGKQLPIGGGLITAKVQAVADHNGSDLKSIEFEYPIQVCKGCLMVADPTATCPATPPAVALSNGCGLPQDAKVFCCTDTFGGRRCYTQEELDALATN